MFNEGAVTQNQSGASSSTCARGDDVQEHHGNDSGHVVWTHYEFSSSSSKNGSSDSSGNQRRKKLPFETPDLELRNGETSGESSSQNDLSELFQQIEAIQEERIELPLDQNIQRLRALPYDQLASMLPKDEEGNPTSIGSLNHGIGVCGPCVYMTRNRGCRMGVNCSFCHLPHEGVVRHSKCRPGQKKRKGFKNTIDILKSKVDENPEGFDAETTRYPASVERNLKKKEKVKAILKDHQIQTVALNTVDRYREVIPESVQTCKLQL